MACDTQIKAGQTAAQRKAEIRAAAAKLEAKLKAGTARVTISPAGGVAFVGWGDSEREGVSDVCAYRVLTSAGSAELRRAIGRAEVTSGRRVSAAAVAFGTHSHDGGKTWHKGH